MNIIVCVKQVPDPEIPPARFKINPDTKTVAPPPGVPPVISVFDERAVEAACRLKEKHGGKITALSMGAGKIDVVKHALSMGADDGAILQDALFENADSYATASILCKAIKKVGTFDLILCGRQAADWDQGQVGALIAEILGIPIVSIARKVELAEGTLRVERVLKDGYEVIEAPIPSVVTVSNELGLPRLPTGMGIITAARKKIPVWTARDIGYEPAAPLNQIMDLFVPVREAKCTIITGETTAQAAEALAQKLRDESLL